MKFIYFVFFRVCHTAEPAPQVSMQRVQDHIVFLHVSLNHNARYFYVLPN